MILYLYNLTIETTIRFIGRGSGANLVVGSYGTGDVLELRNSDKSGWARQDVRKTQTIAKVQQVIITMSLFVD